MSPRLLTFLLLFPLVSQGASAPKPKATDSHREELKFAVVVTRHGIRSPTGKAEQYSKFASAPWPAWSVPPGNLTEHGFREIKLEGAYEREALAAKGLLRPSGCGDAGSVTIHADSDQRTLETGKAYAAGLFPGCAFDIAARSEGTNDPLFHAPADSMGAPDRERARAELDARIHGDPAWLTETFRPELRRLDAALAGCRDPHPTSPRASIFDVPASLSAGTDDHAVQMKGPLFTASTLSEIFLLEYAEGMPMADVGWGCLSPADIRALIHLHTAAFDYAQRTRAVARLQGQAMMNAILGALRQAATGKADPMAPSRLNDKLLVLAGHDTNLANLAGMLDLHWELDGRADDTPPGSALIFELWHDTVTRHDFVRISFQAPTLEQMREETPLTLATPPLHQELTVPGCGGNGQCGLDELKRIALAAK